MRTLLVLPLFAALMACPRIDTDTGPIHAGPAGGIFIREGAAIDIPPGALATDVQITVSMTDTGIPEIPERKRVSLGYRFSPGSLVFKSPVKISVPYLEDRFPVQGLDLNTLDQRRGTPDDAYLALPSPSTNTEYKVVTASTERLGLFWNTSPAQPAVAELKIDPTEAFLNPNQEQQFTATVLNPDGTTNPDLEVTWKVLPPRVATVDETGLVKTAAPGIATVVASVGKLTAKATVYVQGNAVGPQSFQHDNPFPTGNDLWGGAVYGGSTYFVGGNATVLSKNASDAWTRHFSNPAVTLKAIGGSAANGAVAVGISGNSGVLVELKSGSTAPTVKSFSTVEPRALAFDGTHGMAVGYGNDVIVLRNGEWVTEYSPSVETLLSVVGDGTGLFTTVGSRGSIYQFDPVTKTWNSLYQSQLSVLLNAGQLLNAAGTEAWAVGGNKLWHYQAGGWTAVNLPASPVLSEATALGLIDSKVVIAGREGKQGHVLVYTVAGTSWTTQPVRAPQIIRGIFADGAQTGYAVGDLGAVWKYNAGTFTELSRGFYGSVVDLSVSGTQVVAAVNECFDADCQTRYGRAMLRQGPADWRQLGDDFAGPVFSILMRSPTEIYAGTDSQLLRWDGSAWTAITISGSLGGAITDLTACSSGTVWATGIFGSLYKGGGNLFSAQQPLGLDDLYAVHCAGDDNVWVAGDGVLFENRMPRNTEGINQNYWRAVWSPGKGEAFVFGDSNYGLYWDSEELRVLQSPGGIWPDILNGMWGSSIDNLYAVGYTLTPLAFGYAIRFNGAQWRLVDSGAHRKSNAISGSSNLEVWIGTEGGGILRGVNP